MSQEQKATNEQTRSTASGLSRQIKNTQRGTV